MNWMKRQKRGTGMTDQRSGKVVIVVKEEKGQTPMAQ
jgi:hypothetical protein